MTDEFRNIPGRKDLLINKKGHVKVIKKDITVIKKNLLALTIDFEGDWHSVKVRHIVEVLFGNLEEKCQNSHSI